MVSKLLLAVQSFDTPQQVGSFSTSTLLSTRIQFEIQNFKKFIFHSINYKLKQGITNEGFHS